MSYCEKKLKELERIKKTRSLTEEEDETYCYCKSQLQIEAWEEENINCFILF